MNAMPSGWRSAAGIAAIAFATLLHELLLVRWVSARLLNNYAFLIISLSMAGFAIGGLLLALWADRIVRKIEDHVGRLFDLYSITTLACWSLFGTLSVPAEATRLSSDAVPLSLAFSLVLAVPFVFSGLAVGSYLSVPGERTGRLYAFDLCAAALGCVVSVAGVWALGLERTVAGACLLVVLVRIGLYLPRRKPEAVLSVVAILVSLFAVVAPELVLAIKPVPASMLDYVLRANGRIVETRWDPAARVEVAETPAGVLPHMLRIWPSLTGADRALAQDMRAMLTQNNYAFTVMIDREGPPETFAGVLQTIYSAAYVAGAQRAPHPKAITIGVGGGFDVLTALVNGASSITGVEINGATLSILADRYRDKPGHFLNDPRVHLVRADGRNYIARSKERFDVIQLSGVDSYSGAQGSTHVFSETYLYTLEAMGEYLHHLTPGGVLNVMRLEHPAPKEMLRIVSTLVSALRKVGVANPANHIVCVQQRGGAFMAALVSLTPWTREEVDHISKWVDAQSALEMAADPFFVGAERTNHEAFLRDAAKGLEDTVREEYPAILWPATDDWPFFFQFSRWSDLPAWLSGKNVAKPVLPLALALLSLLLGGLMLVTVITPLAVFARRGLKMRRPGEHLSYFALIGLGFLGVEIYLMQRLALLLGGQTYSVTVVLASLLVSGGVGALLSQRIFRIVRRPVRAAFGLVGVALLFPALEGPLRDAIALDFSVRIMISVCLTVPLGLLMGLWFPLGLDHLKATAPAFAPWAWGVNGVFSVLAPILAIASATTFGQTLTFLFALPMYLLAGAIADRLGMWNPSQDRMVIVGDSRV